MAGGGTLRAWRVDLRCSRGHQDVAHARGSGMLVQVGMGRERQTRMGAEPDVAQEVVGALVAAAK